MATKRYQRDLKELEARRRRGMRMLARGVPQAEVARACGVSRQTAMTWQRRLDADPQAWRRRPLGRPGVFDAKQRARLRKLLLQGAVVNGFPTELWTLRRVATLIEREFGHAFSISYVWQVLRDLGFSAQRPVGRASQRDAVAIRDWKEKRWPALKKTPDVAAAPSSSSTNPD
jgi:transposase